MKDIEKLKAEQEQLKERLHKLIDYMNSEEYYYLDSSEKSLLGTQSASMEVYLDTLTKRIYGNDKKGSVGSSLLSFFLMSMLGGPMGFPTVDVSKDELKEIEAKEDERE